jgi:hypothetical protein
MAKRRWCKVVDIHNPAIALHLAPADKRNDTAIVLAAGGGNCELNIPFGTWHQRFLEWLRDLQAPAAAP